MDILLTRDERAVKGTRQRQQLVAVQCLLDSHQDHQSRRFLRKLADYLLFPDGYLISLPAPLLAWLIDQTLDFIETKSEAVALKIVPLDNSDNRLLLVSCPNVPHIVDSIMALQTKLDIAVELLAHPVLSVRRREGQVVYLETDVLSGGTELLIVIRLDYRDEYSDALLLQGITRAIAAALKVDRSRAEIHGKLNGLKQIASLEKFAAFIDWLRNDAFVFVAWQRFSSDLSAQQMISLAEDALTDIASYACYDADFPCGLKNILARQTEVIVETIPVISPIIQARPLVYLGFRQTGPDGAWVEHSFFGLFDEVELNGTPSTIPALNEKIDHMLHAIKVYRDSHEYFQLKEIFNLFPKIEVFLSDDIQLHLIAQSLKRYLYRPEVIKLLILASASPNRISALIIVPIALDREGIEAVLFDLLCRELACTVENSRKTIPGGSYVGLQVVLVPERERTTINVERLDSQLNRLARPWSVSFMQLAERAFGRKIDSRLWQKYPSLFSAEYQARVSPRYAIKDIVELKQVLASGAQRVNLLSPYREIEHYRLHFYSRQERFLDEYIPMLENMSLRVIDQMQFCVTLDGTTLFIKSFTIKAAKSQYASFNRLKCCMLEMAQAILDGKAENDALNSLLITTGMSWQDIDVLRAYRNYYLQLGYQTTLASLHRALLNNPHVAHFLFKYFEARFRPDPAWQDFMVREDQVLFPLRLQLLESFASVTDINSDRILRTLFNLIDATMRSNFHRRRSQPDYFIAFKINSLGIIDLQPPRPQHEIYVHAYDMEGIHLRAGRISRGGIRWSDRPDDFRTEILGLMQTQISKNALIIPTGAKGGFVLKKNGVPLDLKAAGKKAYITLIKGLLDLTDNYDGDQVVKPEGLVTYDDADPYLVVAADKGTAQFSDIANAISEDYRFWLGDAFASGGSRGYNHKALGITARGAWECVKRHFRELGKDIQKEPFTVVGIGSMDGDVFGNGMLLSPCIRLLATFSGQHIFIDPDPMPGDAPFNERKRLFELPGSSWDDYDRSLISEGGGVYLRSAKDIPVSAKLRKWLGVRYQTLDGESLIRYLLAAPVELLWLGGIGTYVKAAMEKHEEVGDRSNDSVRVNAVELGARVVGEGANLGFTQKARVEYSLKGGRINTDAVDNSAGVDTSDHEVNLKILLTGLQKKNVISDYQQLFVSMTDEVCQLVLADNYAQSLCLSLDVRRCADNPEVFLHLAERLEAAGIFDRVVESFPLTKQVLARPGQTLTRPELAVLMAAAKMQLTQQIQEQIALLEEGCCERYLQAYFPGQVNERYKDYLPGHALSNEIRATVVSNKIINQAGCGFLSLDIDRQNINTMDNVTCYLTFDQVLDGDTFRQTVYALDNRLAADRQYSLLLELESILAGFCRWALIHGRKIRPNEQTVSGYQRYLAAYKAHFDETGLTETEPFQARFDACRQQGVPDALARRIVFITSLQDFPQIVSLAAETAKDFIGVLKLFNDTSAYLGLYAIYEQLAAMPLHDHWERRVANDLQEGMKQTVGRLIKTMALKNAETCAAYFEQSREKQKLNRYRRIYKDIDMTLPTSLLPYIALNRELEGLVNQNGSS
ncbi:NAD-glutamate dehydrogenase domain-containing protein [Methylobacter luteus]|uniref:NAD-glutamate dehydrogenase domain-containing protein n=1 Tax=Methylobacter luteus TaxID=415 RepID=UPI0004227D7A|nr:NAD-glutamate dehydrogenase domain-containing protein [Methylobacter luteus]